MKLPLSTKTTVYYLIALGFTLLAGFKASAKDIELLNVSYDPTRELWRDRNAAFIAKYEKEHPGDKLSIKQSHGGSSTQA